MNDRRRAADNARYHAVNTAGGVDRYDYDANGNMTIYNTGNNPQNLTWNAEIL